MKRIVCLWVSVVLFWGGQAVAQELGEGLLSAVSYQPLPSGHSISVRIVNDSDDNLEIAKAFETALQASGYTLSDTAPILLTFETRDQVGAWSTADRRTIVEIEGHGDSATGQDHKVRFNLFNSNSGGMFNRGETSGTSIVTPSRYRLDAMVEDRATGRRLWHAWAIAAVSQSERHQLLEAMINPIVENVGQTVKRAPFKAE